MILPPPTKILQFQFSPPWLTEPAVGTGSILLVSDFWISFFQGNLALGFSPTSPSYDFWCCWIWWYFWSSFWWFCSQSCSPDTRSPTAALFSFHLKTWVSIRGLDCHEECSFHCVPSYSASFSAAAAAKSLQSCPTLCNPIDGSPPGSPIPGILQARTVEWVAISFSNAWKWKVKVNHSVMSNS